MITRNHWLRRQTLTGIFAIAIVGLWALPNQIARANDSAAAKVLERIRQHTFHPLHKGFTKDSKLDRHGIAELSNDDWRVRTLAVRDLVRLSPQAIPVLLNGLEDENLHVRQVSALVLGVLPTTDDTSDVRSARLQGLLSRLRDDPESVVRSEAAIALGRIGEPRSEEVLKQAADEDPSRDVRHQCALALDQIANPTSDRSLYEAYRSLDESSFHAIAVGEPAADFTLLDTEGRQWTLSDYRGKKTVVLIWIFADWCPVCHGEFRELVEMKQDFIDSDVEVATIECHEPYRCRVMVGQELIPRYWFAKQQAPQLEYHQRLWWRHLADPAGAVGAMYGVQPLAFAVHSEYINRPSTIIIDKEGIVRFAYYGTYWGDRPSIRQTLDMVRTGKFAFEHPKRLRGNP